jgi:hypothetical protein
MKTAGQMGGHDKHNSLFSQPKNNVPSLIARNNHRQNVIPHISVLVRIK